MVSRKEFKRKLLYNYKTCLHEKPLTYLLLCHCDTHSGISEFVFGFLVTYQKDNFFVNIILAIKT